MRAGVVVVALAGCGRLGFEPRGDAAADGDAAVPSTRVSVSDYHACAIDPAQTLRCWGGSFSGEVGLGTYDTYLVPTVVGDPGWTAVATGTGTTFALRADGAAFAWGSNGSGQLGLGDYDERTAPVPLAAPAPLVALTSESYDTIALTADGERCVWGRNIGTGALGVGDDYGPVAPRRVDATRWSDVEMGFGAACGIRDDATLWCWGSGNALGLGGATQALTPAQVAPGTTWRSIAVGAGHACGVQSDGSLWCWGSNNQGALGDPSLGAETSPARISAGPWTAVTAGVATSCAIDAQAGLWCWGDNTSGQLGVGDRADRGVPTAVAPGTTWRSVDGSGQYSACGVQLDDSVWCWGAGTDGRLGTGDTADQLVPARVL